MPGVVRIYGTARNLAQSPPPSKGEEVWLCNNPEIFRIRLPRALLEWTRWFNLHSRAWMLHKYPKGFAYYQESANGRPIYFQKAQPDVLTSVAFPKDEIQKAFALPDGMPNRYFTSSACWLLALAIYEGFEEIDLYGFALSTSKRVTGPCYVFERPAFFYWVQQARDRGITVRYPAAIAKLAFVSGDPATYAGLLYGYETKPEE